MSDPTVTQNKYPYRSEPTWSTSEKRIARRVFDAALKRELQDVMRETRKMANKIKEPADVWDLEHYLTERRKDINRRYEFRSSRLMQVFGVLLSERRILEEELRGLGEDKIRAIRSCAQVLSESAA